MALAKIVSLEILNKNLESPKPISVMKLCSFEDFVKKSPPQSAKLHLTCNSTLRYECDETFSDECEFAARAEGE